MKERTKKILLILFAFFVTFCTFSKQVYAEINGDISEEEGTLYIPFTKNWQDVKESDRPSSVTIKLYKYIGDSFDESTAILIEAKEVTSEMEWKYNFDISNVELFDSSNNAYKFKIVEEIIDGYEEIESLHVDPNVIFTPPSIGDGWERIEPCSEIDISTSGNLKSIIIAKMTGNQGNKFIVWTVDPLSEAERKIVYESAKSINGFGNPNYDAFIFISGTIGEYYYNNQKVITVDENHIYFEGGKRVWSLFATGIYYKSSTEANVSSITNTIKKINLSIEKIWNDHKDILGLRPSFVTIQLLKNGEVIDEVELSHSNNWKYEFTNLVQYTDGTENQYTIKEKDVDGYNSSQVRDGNTIVITNTCTYTYVLPETGSNKVIILSIISILLIGVPIIHSVYSFIRKDI